MDIHDLLFIKGFLFGFARLKFFFYLGEKGGGVLFIELSELNCA